MFKIFLRSVMFSTVVVVLGIGCVSAFAGDGDTLLDGNMISNPSFEYDNHNNQAEGHVLAFRADWSFNSSDLEPDHWHSNSPIEHLEGDAHTGNRSLLLKGKSSITRTFKLGAWTPLTGHSWGGSGEKPMEYDEPVRAARTVRVRLYYKARSLAGDNKFTVEINSFGITKTKTIDQSAAEWTQLDLELSQSEIEKEYSEKEARKAEKTKELPRQQTVKITTYGEAEVYIDDVSLAEDLSNDLNLAAENYSFENIDNNGYPVGWGNPIKYNWRPQQYYKWTDWHHWFREPRGPVNTNNLIARTGRRSLQMQVYPGDEMKVRGKPVILNQTERGVIEIGVFVKLDRVKWIDLRAVDQGGENVSTVGGFAGGWCVPTDQDTHQLFPSNAKNWIYIRKWFQAEKPMKSISPELCARGYNGDTRDDAGTRPNVCQTGVVWWDDLRVIDRTSTVADLKARGVELAAPVKEKPYSVMIDSIDPGARLFGDNTATVILTNPTDKDQKVKLSLCVAPSSRAKKKCGRWRNKASKTRTTVPAGQSVSVSLPYAIDMLDGEWDKQGQMAFVVNAGLRKRTTQFAYNTWPVVVDFDFSKHYATPEENPQSVTFNFGVGNGTLAKTESIAIDICRRRDDSAVETITIDDPARAMAESLVGLPMDTEMKDKEGFGFEFGAPSPVYWADKKNLIVRKMDFSKLPVHPVDHPVRDHYLQIRGLNARGETLFADKSQYFGRVEQINEVLPPIEKTEVRNDGSILVNGKPMFMLADGIYITGRYMLTPEQIKKYGFNSIRWSAIRDFDKINLYTLETMIFTDNREVDPEKRFTEERIRKWKEEGKLDGVVTISNYYEHSAIHFPPGQIEKEKEYVRICHDVANRAANYGGGGAHNIYTIEDMFGIYDSFGLELEPMGPPHGGYDLAPVLRMGGVAWFNLPQAYDPTPFEQFRLDQYDAIIQGARGYSIIQGLGDPSLYRGINGELRGLSPAIFSLDTGDPRTEATPDIKWMQRRNGNKTTIIAVSVPPVEMGDWTWRKKNVAKGKRAHTGISAFTANQTPDGLRLHGFRQMKPIQIKAGDRLVQYVWLDPKSTPGAISWGVRGDAKWDFNGHWGQQFDFNKWRKEFVNFWAAGELIPGTWNIGYAYDDKTRNWFADHIFTPDSFKSKGKLPAAGKWTRLELSAEELGLVGKQLDGFLYLAKDGEAWWDHSALVRDGQEIVICEDMVGHPREDLANVQFSVPWAPEGTRVKVLFEERDLVVENGSFVDDFRGEDTYATVRDGAVADAIGWHPFGAKLHGQTVGYLTPNAPTIVHIYEIVHGEK